jgi:hypothetical protein
MKLHSSLLQLAFVCWLCTACDGTTHAEGQVRDESGAPIVGALVTMERSGASATTQTDSAGKYAITQVHGVGHASVELRICKSGFQSGRRAFARDDSITTPTDVVLHRQMPVAEIDPAPMSISACG